MLDHLERRNRVVISAHSQGSVTAFAAVAPLARSHEGLALGTYGSPIRSLYVYVFPPYFGTDAVTALCRRLRVEDGREAGATSTATRI